MSIAETAHDLASQSGVDERGLRQCDGLRLLIVGNGMASFGLCKRLVESEAGSDFSISVLGQEPTPAYDRVNLSKLFTGKSADDLQLANRDWYAKNQVHLETGCQITEIDREAKEVVDANGRRHPYNRLVIATGSRPRVPPIPGTDSPGVFVYRTLADLENIRDYVLQKGARAGAVIGGGLLGLEAAKVLLDLGLHTSVIEMAPGLMPRQLDAKGAEILKERIEQIGVHVHIVRRTKAIKPQDDGGIEIDFFNADPLNTDLLIIAAGVIPNDDLGRDCGLEVADRGGIVVNDQLQTSDPNIFAIGECVSFRDHVYGLVAPCYRMADVLAARLSGESEVFRGADESAELKLLGVNVAVLGMGIGEVSGVVTMTHRNGDNYRKLVLYRGEIVGAACVGDWEELPQIRQAVYDQRRLWPWQRTRFYRSGSPWSPGGAIPIADWPARSVVCSCHEVSKGTLDELIAEGFSQPDLLAEKSGASTACGSCRSLVCELAGAERDVQPVQGATSMLVASICGALFVALLFLIPPIRFADSVQSGWRQVDILWRSDLARQVTGFSLLGLLLIGLVFSLRKRTGWFHWGSYALWRSIHGILGAAVLVALAVHTGFRLGENLNLVLSLTFIAVAALGTIAGTFSSLESRVTGSWAMLIRQWRPRLTRIHLWLFWPIPLLIAFHIFSFYWFND
ncbi:MAG: FAD-dependent oxidoreductase [Rubripirellula sp.]